MKAEARSEASGGELPLPKNGDGEPKKYSGTQCFAVTGGKRLQRIARRRSAAHRRT
ncbi:MAG: hypothetical protein CM1200mP9_12000 [Gammaproteobacteria bacterium]|nr:MAG: hypothetical protein CM1200mP9_12000 [Gammaproteobacteria bacterium]